MYNLDNKLPTGWAYKKLGDVCEILSGGTPKTTMPEYWGGDIPWITPTEITKLKTPFITSLTKRTITKLGFKKSSAKMIPKNSLIVCSRATIGTCAINTYDTATNQGFKNLIPNENMNTLYLYMLISSMKNELLQISSGTTFLEFSKTNFSNLKIPVPPLAEQERIATILDKIQTLITTYEQELKEYDNLIRSQFNNLFGDPITNPKNYPIKKISDVCEIVRGLTYKPHNKHIEPNENTSLVLRANNISNLNVNLKDLIYVDTNIIKPKQFLKKHDIFMSASSGSLKAIGKSAYINKDYNSAFGGFCMVLRSNKLFSKYLFSYVNTPYFRSWVESSNGSNIKNIQKTALSNLKIPIPPLSEQENFSNFTERIETLKHHTTQKLTQAIELFNSTSQQAFKGNL